MPPISVLIKPSSGLCNMKCDTVSTAMKQKREHGNPMDL